MAKSEVSFLLGQSVKPHLYLFFEVLKVEYLFKCAELVSLDFVQSQKALGSPPGQFDGLDLLLRQPILDLGLLDLPLPLLLGRVVAGVDDEIVFPGNPRFLHIVLEDLFQIQVQPHEIT